MFVRNFLSNGEYVSVVPVGILTTIQYDPNGRIERVINGPTEGDVDVTKEFLQPILDNGLVPRTILAKGGRSWIYGVLYTNVLKYLNVDGVLPEVIYPSLKKAFFENPKSFSFAAHSAKSLSMVLRGSLATRQWLTSSSFNILPGMPLSPEVLKEENFADRLEKYLGDNAYFDFPLVGGYCVYKDGQPTYYSADMRLETVTKTSQKVDFHGNIIMEINDGRIFDYGECVNRYNIQKDVVMLLDCYGNIIHTYKNGLSVVGDRHETVMCPICGNIFYPIPGSATKCSDPRCNSKMFIPTNNFLSALRLPNVTYAAFQETVKKVGLNYSVVDILDRPEYNYEIRANLPTLLYAIIPRSVIADFQSIVLLCNRCYNTLDNVMYKFSNLGVLEKDVDIPEISRLIDWLKDDRNINDIRKLVDHPNVKIGSDFKKFEGAPIFRNLRICITGDFIHGSNLDIKNIFTSYSGTVVNDVKDANVLVVGGTQTNINGTVIKTAREKGITIFDEYSFFDRYDIDSDLHNLE